MYRTWIVIAAVNGLISVVLGAFGAHGLEKLVDKSKLATFDVGVRYQMYHALAMLAVAWVMSIAPTRTATASGVCMLVGIVLFSGSIYGLVLTSWKWLGPVTPIGGTLLMVGWLLLAIAAARLGPSSAVGMPAAN